MKLILVRHCEPDWPEGWTDADVGLTQDGRDQAQAVAAELARRLGPGSDAPIVSSPARRVRETADVIAGGLGASVEENELLWLKQLADPAVRRRFVEGSADVALLSELEDVSQRALEWAAQVAQERPDGTLVAVSHDTVIAGIVCRVLSLPMTGMRRFRVDMGSLSVVDFRAQRTILASLNETYHLESLAPA